MEQSRTLKHFYRSRSHSQNDGRSLSLRKQPTLQCVRDHKLRTDIAFSSQGQGGSTGSGVNWPTLFQVRVKKYLLTPTLNVYKLTKRVYCCVSVSLSCTTHSVHYAHKTDTFYNPCIDCHSRTVILCSQNPKNNHQINYQQWTQAVSRIALLHFHHDRIYTHKMDLNDLCQTFVSSRPNECRESISLANRWHYVNACRCAELLSFQCAVYKGLHYSTTENQKWPKVWVKT